MKDSSNFWEIKQRHSNRLIEKDLGGLAMDNVRVRTEFSLILLPVPGGRKARKRHLKRWLDDVGVNLRNMGTEDREE